MAHCLAVLVEASHSVHSATCNALQGDCFMLANTSVARYTFLNAIPRLCFYFTLYTTIYNSNSSVKMLHKYCKTNLLLQVSFNSMCPISFTIASVLVSQIT